MQKKLFPRTSSWLAMLLLAIHTCTAAVPGDEHWDNEFGPAGTSDPLYAIASFNGNIYAGGLLTAAGNTKANFIAGYDGTNWFALNNGVSGGLNTTYIFTLAASATELYAGGWFTNADGSGAKYLGRWDGSTWWPLGGSPANNPNSIVEAVKIAGTNLYVGGLFTTNGGVTVNRIAKWNGSSWSALGAGVSGGAQPIVTAIETNGNFVYVGGTFTQAGSVNATNVAVWDGSNWSALGTAINGPVLALAKVGGYLYVGGSFTNTSLALTNLARWNGSTWSAVGAAGANRMVRALLSDGTNLYVGGDFTSLGGIAANRIAKWDGAAWSALDVGVQSFGAGASPGVYSLAFDTNGWLYAVGNFNQAGSVGASHVAGWNGTAWFALGATSKGMTHFDGDVQSFCFDGTDLYAGGLFVEAGDVIVNGIAQWDGANWNVIGNAAPGKLLGSSPVKALTAANGYLYAGGSFTNIGGVTAASVAQWDGANWSPMGGGFNGIVYALAVHQGVLFAGGSFTGTADGSVSLHGIAQWNGNSWTDVPQIDVWRVNNSINALVSDGTYLYAGGNFYLGWGFAPPNPTVGADVYNLGYWDGTHWWPIGSSAPSNTVSALAVTNGLLYAAGSFTGISGIKANRIAQWNGSSWTALGSGLNPGASSGAVGAVAVIGGNVYAAGSFTNAGGTTVRSIAQWNGSTWSALGSGLYLSVTSSQGTGHTLATSGNDLYVGGLFSSAGDKPAMFISRWNDQTNFYPPPHPMLTRQAWFTNQQFSFRLTGTSGESYILQASTNLQDWISLQTNTATRYDFTDPAAATYSRRFYRAVLGP